MEVQVARRATLLASIPVDRYRARSADGRAPKAGDVVVLDQGFTAADGRPMVLVYLPGDAGISLYEAEVYESELG